LNNFGLKGSGKTHLSKILEKKIDKIKLVDAKDVKNETIQDLLNLDCLIIDNYQDNIDEKLFYSILNQSKQLENYLLINTNNALKNSNFHLEDLKSRIRSFLFIGIDLPTDDLLKVIISKTLSDKQISINPKLSDFIINNVDRSYEKMFKFLKDVDELSLSTGKSININLIKKVLNQ
jgi:chromosomal replication initiation ATPase DnaA